MNIYPIDQCAVFFKTREEFGELSNMAGGFPLMWEGITVHSSEALYQAHKFLPGSVPFEAVISEKNAMVSKMRAKKLEYRSQLRPDWDDIKIDVMNYCLRLKYLHHKMIIDDVLYMTAGRDIVEKSRKDQLWGAINDYRGNLVGNNLLGSLWMIIRDETPNVELPDMIIPSSHLAQL